MNNQHQNKRSKRSKKTPSFARETTAILRHVQTDNRIYRRRLVSTFGITSTVVGIINNTFNMDPSATTDWASCSALYDEFRVVGIKLTIVSRLQNTVTGASNAVLIAYDNDNTTSFGSYAQMSEYQTVRVIPSFWNDSKVFTFSFSRPSSGTETSLPWNDIGVPAASNGGIGMYADGLSSSVVYFFAMCEYAVEFRGMR